MNIFILVPIRLLNQANSQNRMEKNVFLEPSPSLHLLLLVPSIKAHSGFSGAKMIILNQDEPELLLLYTVNAEQRGGKNE